MVDGVACVRISVLLVMSYALGNTNMLTCAWTSVDAAGREISEER